MNCFGYLDFLAHVAVKSMAEFRFSFSSKTGELLGTQAACGKAPIHIPISFTKKKTFELLSILELRYVILTRKRKFLL